MKPDYKRPERFGFTFEQYTMEYKKRYPDYGPSQSSDCGDWNDPSNCGCWVCRYITWKNIYYGSATSGSGGSGSHNATSYRSIYWWDRFCGIFVLIREKYYNFRERESN